MATQNFRQIALSQLGYTLADLRDANRRAEIIATAKELEAAATNTRTGDTVRQWQVAQMLNNFAGFADNPDEYGPTVAEIHSALVESGLDIKRPAVGMHLSKLRNAGYIDSARKLEGTGKRGAPPVFYFLATDEDTWAQVCNGVITAS